jgi:tetratricopeptide (TPR) repeat protein
MTMTWAGIILLAVLHLANPSMRDGFAIRPDLTGFAFTVLLGNILRTAREFLAAGASLALMWVAGVGILRWLSRGSRGRMDALAGGLLAGSLAIMGFGLAGLLRLPVIGAAVLLAVLASRPRRMGRPALNCRAVFGEFWPALLLVPVLPWIVAAPLLPPVNVDILEYHLGLPVEWAEAHRIAGFAGNVLGSMPLGFERLGVPFALAGLPGAVPAFHLLLLAVSSLVFARALAPAASIASGTGAARRSPKPEAALAPAPLASLGGWLLFSTGWILNQAAEGHPDTGLVLATTAGLLALARGSVMALGLAAALAAFAKYQGCGLAAALFIAGTMGSRPRAADLLRKVLPAVALCLVPCLPWLARNWYETGNPVYPLFARVIPSLHWTEWNTRVLWGSMPNAGITLAWETPAGAALSYALAFWNGARTAWFTPYAGLVYLLPLIVLARGSNPAVRRFALAGLLFAAVWLVPFPKFGRYLIPGAICALAAFLAAIPARAVNRPLRAALALLMLAEGASFVALFRRPSAPAERVLAGGLSGEGYRAAALGKYREAVERLNAIPADPGRRDRVLVMGLGHGFGLSRPTLANNETGYPGFLAAAGQVADAARMRVGFRQHGVRWILYNPIGSYHRSPYWAGYDRSEEWWKEYAGLWRRWIRATSPPGAWDSTGAWYLASVSGRPGPCTPHPWLPGAERFLLVEKDLLHGNADLGILAVQRRIMGDFGVSLLQSAIAEAAHPADAGKPVYLCRAAIAAGLETPGAWNVLGYFLWEGGNLAGAGRAFARALELDPEYAPARGNLADLDRAPGRRTNSR